MSTIKYFMENNFKNFNARTTLEAAKAFKTFVEEGNKIIVTLAGAASSSQIGRSLAEMINNKKVAAVCCTAANLEEDVLLLLNTSKYKSVSNWRNLSLEDDTKFYDEKYARVLDTLIPEEAFINLGNLLLNIWIKNDQENTPKFPHENIFELFKNKSLENINSENLKNSWVFACYEKGVPIYTPGFEDSTMGNIFSSYCKKGIIKNPHSVRTGIEYMLHLYNWYIENDKSCKQGMMQLGGGIAGDFVAAVIPSILFDLELNVKKWAYHCQITDSETSMGGFSGCTVSEKITWGKTDKNTQGFHINSDFSIVAPLIFNYVLGH